MDTTTSDGGAQVAQPQETPEAVTTGYNADQVITTDNNGTPSMEPVTSDATEDTTPQSADEAVTVETQTATETQANDDLAKFASAKGFDPATLTDGERKALEMARNAEKRMHEATQVHSVVQPPEILSEESDDPVIQQIVQDQNETKLKLYVRDWFDSNPDAKEHRLELQQIAGQRPWLQNMDDVYAHFLANPSRTEAIEKEGGRKALTNLAQKQAQVPPASGATNSGAFQSQQITSSNVYELVDSNDQAWFEKNHDAISRAMSGK